MVTYAFPWPSVTLALIFLNSFDWKIGLAVAVGTTFVARVALDLREWELEKAAPRNEIVIYFPAIHGPENESVEQRIERTHEFTKAVTRLTEVTLDPLYEHCQVRVVFAGACVEPWDGAVFDRLFIACCP